MPGVGTTRPHHPFPTGKWGCGPGMTCQQWFFAPQSSYQQGISAQLVLWSLHIADSFFPHAWGRPYPGLPADQEAKATCGRVPAVGAHTELPRIQSAPPV